MVWSTRSRVIIIDTGSSEENLATSWEHPGGSSFWQEGSIAAMPQPDWQASLRGLQAERRHPVSRMRARKPFGLLVLLIWIFLRLCYCFRSGFSKSLSANDCIQWNGEHADNQSPKKVTAFGAVFRFFSPTTCIAKENQVMKPCNAPRILNESECLSCKCCHSSSGTSNLWCFAPFEDKTTQMLWMFGLGVFIMIILGCLPIYCCSLCRRRDKVGVKAQSSTRTIMREVRCLGIKFKETLTLRFMQEKRLYMHNSEITYLLEFFGKEKAHVEDKWANPLWRKVSRMLKCLKKQRNKRKKDAEMLEPVMENEEASKGDKREQETRALVSH